MREQIIHNLPNVLKAHDVIQWLFPSDLPSRAVPNSCASERDRAEMAARQRRGSESGCAKR
jgi:hypothetical protein